MGTGGGCRQRLLAAQGAVRSIAALPTKDWLWQRQVLHLSPPLQATPPSSSTHTHT